MSKKKVFTYEQHQETGAELKRISSWVNTLVIELSHHYPIAVANECMKVDKSLAGIRALLDDKLFSEHGTGRICPGNPENMKMLNVYFNRGGD